MTRRFTVVIRADAGSQIGVGHVMRCLALSQEIQRRGHRVVMIAASLPERLVERLRREGLDVEHVAVAPGSDEDAAETLKAVHDRGASWLVVDGYRFGPGYLAAVGHAPCPALVIDDMAQQTSYRGAAIVVNSNLGITAAEYEGKLHAATLLLGTRYVLLRREFLTESRGRAVVDRSRAHVVIAFGGADPAGKSMEAVSAVEQLDGEVVRATLVLGPSMAHVEPVQRAAARMPDRIALERDVTDMAALLRTADVALIAAGSTIWETCYLAVPTASIVVAPNQRRNAEGVHQAGATLLLGDAVDVDPMHMARAVTTLIGDRARRGAMAEAGRRLVDGRGAERVVTAMGLEFPT